MEKHTHKPTTTLLCMIQSRPTLLLFKQFSSIKVNLIPAPVYWLVSLCLRMGLITTIVRSHCAALGTLARKGSAKNHRYTQISLFIYHAE